MKKLLLIAILGISSLSIMAQQKTLTLVMSYRWNFDTNTNSLLSEWACQDGIEFDFVGKKAHYYTPDGDVSTTLCNVTKVSEPVFNNDNTTTFEYQLYEVGREKYINCVLTVSDDLKSLKFTMISDGKATVYKVTNMLTDEDN